MSSIIKPSREALADPEQALLIVMRLWEAVDALQKTAGAASPLSSANAQGRSELVVIRGATVTDPKSSQTFTADVFAVGVRV